MSPTSSPSLGVFLASPGDVADERAVMRRLLKDELPYRPLINGRVMFNVVSWDDPLAPKPMLATMTPQEAVIRFGAKPAECDIVIVVLWSRLGTHLDVRAFRKPNGDAYLSGTEWEFEDALNANPQPDILVYRRAEVPNLKVNDPDFEEKRHQYQLVVEFCGRLTRNPDGSFRSSVTEYGTPTDFKERLANDLEYLLRERLDRGTLGSAASVVSVWSGSPYPGLRPFTSEEAPIFFGRGREVDALIARLRDPTQRFLAVVGGSGTGKSSLIRAGLLPRLAAGSIMESQHWRVLTFRPGSTGDNPFLALAVELKALLPESVQRPPIEIALALAEKPQGLTEIAATALADRPPGADLVLFVDQLEELFALATEKYRDAFARLLAQAAGVPRLRVLATLRADFLPQAMAEPALALRLQVGTIPLGPPGPTALADMICKPAQRAGLDIEEGLIDQILADAGNNAGALPLVAFCLEELHRQSTTTRRLTLEAYRALGGLRGAIGRRMDALLKAFQEAEKVADLDGVLSPVFGVLVHVDAAGVAARQWAFEDELGLLPQPVPRLIETLIREHLLMADEVGGRATVTLAHEALLEEWSALRDWLERNRIQMQRFQRLMMNLEAPESLDRIFAAEALPEMGEAAVSPLIAALGDPSEAVRARVALSLGEIGPAASAAIPALLRALTDADEHVRISVAEALGQIGPVAVPALIEALSGADKSARAGAATALKEIGSAAVEAVPALSRALSDVVAPVRKNAAEALGEIGSPAAMAVPDLIRVLGDTDKDVRAGAAAALNEIGSAAAEAVPALVQALRDVHDAVRANAAASLGAIGSGAAVAVPDLIKAIADADWEVRQNAIRALAQIGPPAAAAIPALLSTALTDVDIRARNAAAHAFGKIGPAATEAVPALIQALSDPEKDARQSAAIALGAIGLRAAEAVPALIGRLGDTKAVVRRNVAEAIAKVGPATPETVSALIQAVADSDKNVRRFALRALQKIGSGAIKAIPILIECLSDAEEDGRIRGLAAGALGKVGPVTAEVVPALIQALADGDTNVRDSAVAALAELGPAAADAIPMFIEWLSDAEEESDIRRLAAEALGKVGPVTAEVVPALIQALADGDTNVRDSAVAALAELGPAAADAIPMFIEWLSDAEEESDIRRLAAEALGKVGPVTAEVVPALIQALADGDTNVRDFAVAALAELGPAAADAIPMFIEWLSDAEEESDIRRLAAEALGKVGPVTAEVVPALIQALRNTDSGVRTTAARALGAIGPQAAAATPVLTKILKDNDETVRQSAADALKSFEQQPS